MARNYDRLIRYYDSWFDDLSDPAKELTPEECWRVILALREAQHHGTTDPLRELPQSVRRALSMSTLIEQTERIIERCNNLRERGSKGGTSTALQGKGSYKRPVDSTPLLAPPADGVERDYDIFTFELCTFGLTNTQINTIARLFNFGAKNTPIWEMIERAKKSNVPHKSLLEQVSVWYNHRNASEGGKEVQS